MSRRASLISALLVALLGLLAPPEAVARNKPDAGRKTLTITVPIDVVLLPGVDRPRMELHLNTAFETYWGEGNKFRFKCRDVVLKLDMNVMPPGKLPRDDARRHRIVVKHVPRGPGIKSEPPPNVDYGMANVDYRPKEHSAQGNWTDHYNLDKVYAHEFGHLLGLRDEYSFQDNNPPNWKRDPGEPTTPVDGVDADGVPYRNSLMADGGPVRQRYIDDIVRQHFKEADLKCKITVRAEVDDSTKYPGSDPANWARARFVLEASATEVDGVGKRLEGEATYAGDREVVQYACGDAKTLVQHETETAKGRDLTIKGLREGADRVSLGLKGKVLFTTTKKARGCSSQDPPTESTESETKSIEHDIYHQLFPLEVELKDGRLQEERVLREGHTTTTIRLLVEDVPDR